MDKSGGWLMLLETSTAGARLNRVVDLFTGTVTVVDGVEGALGHLDMGHGYAVGADPYNPMPKRWDLAVANHLAHGNAVGGAAPEQHYACGSNASRVADMADEIVCFPLDPNRAADGSLGVLVVAPVMSDLDAAGGQDLDGDDYEQLPKGNLDVTGRYLIWTVNAGGDRLDAFLVKIPAERFEAP